MRAKLINEIVRGKESAISSLGIGKIAIFDPLVNMMKELNREKFCITWGDFNEPPIEYEYHFEYYEGHNWFRIQIEGDACDGDEVYMIFNKLTNQVQYKFGDQATLYHKAPEFFKVFSTKEDLSKELQIDMKNYLEKGGFKVYK